MVFHQPDDNTYADEDELHAAMQEAVTPMTFRQRLEAAHKTAADMKRKADVMLAAAKASAEIAELQLHATEQLLREIS